MGFFDCVAFYQCELLRDFQLLYKSVLLMIMLILEGQDVFACVYECNCMCVVISSIFSGWGGVGWCSGLGVEEKGVGCYLSFLSPIHVAFC